MKPDIILPDFCKLLEVDLNVRLINLIVPTLFQSITCVVLNQQWDQEQTSHEISDCCQRETKKNFDLAFRPKCYSAFSRIQSILFALNSKKCRIAFRAIDQIKVFFSFPLTTIRYIMWSLFLISLLLICSRLRRVSMFTARDTLLFILCKKASYPLIWYQF